MEYSRGRWVVIALAAIGALMVLNLVNDWMATLHIRSHDNAISRLEQSLRACNSLMEESDDGAVLKESAAYQERSFQYSICVSDAWENGKEAKDNLLADCNISQYGNFTISSGDSPSFREYVDVPYWYDVPLLYILRGDCKKRINSNTIY